MSDERDDALYHQQLADEAELDEYRQATGGLDPRLVFRIMEQAQYDAAVRRARRVEKTPDIGTWLLSDLDAIVGLHLQCPPARSAGTTEGPIRERSRP